MQESVGFIDDLWAARSEVKKKKQSLVEWWLMERYHKDNTGSHHIHFSKNYAFSTLEKFL